MSDFHVLWRGALARAQYERANFRISPELFIFFGTRSFIADKVVVLVIILSVIPMDLRVSQSIRTGQCVSGTSSLALFDVGTVQDNGYPMQRALALSPVTTSVYFSGEFWAPGAQNTAVSWKGDIHAHTLRLLSDFYSHPTDSESNKQLASVGNAGTCLILNGPASCFNRDRWRFCFVVNGWNGMSHVILILTFRLSEVASWRSMGSR